MKTLSNDEINQHLSLHLKNWAFDKSVIKRDFKFRDFPEAFSFMTAVAFEAEKMDHHPDWCNGFNKVSITLTTHSAKGITSQDFELADKIDQIASKYE